MGDEEFRDRRWPFRRVPSPGEMGSDEEIQEELELHLDLRTEELIEDGWTREAARREATRRFGDANRIERSLRRGARRKGGRDHGRGTMRGILQDVGYAFRTFRRNPGFTLVAAFTLGIAIAGNTAIFSVLDEAVFQALPFPDHQGLVFVNGYHDVDGERAIRMASVPEFRDWQSASRSFEVLVGVDANSLTLTSDGQSERIMGELVSEGYFEMLRAEALLGRTFSPEEASTPDGHPLVILSHGLWLRRFGADPDVVGASLQMNGRGFTVLGVMTESFQGLASDSDAWLPLGMMSVVTGPQTLERRGTRFLPVAGRLRDGTSVEQAQTELDAIARELQSRHPDSHEDRWAEVVPFRTLYLGDTGRLLWVLFAAGSLLLALAAANVANLLLVRSSARTRELTVRRALGAERRRVALQLMTESLVLAALGGALGLVLAWWGLSALIPTIPEGVLPSWVDPGLSPRVLGFTAVVLTVVGVAAGLFPALASAGSDLAATLKAGGRGSAVRSGRAQQLFVVTQVALALLLLVGAGLLTRSFRAQLMVEPGMELDGIYVFRVDPPAESYPDAESLRRFTEDVLREVGSVPRLTSVAASSDFPFRGRSSGSYIVRPDDVESLIRYHRHSVSPGYFDNLGIPLLAGRTFTPADDDASPGVAVVTEAMVRRVFPELDDPTSALGEAFFAGRPDDPENRVEIVGVIEDVRYRNLTQDMMAEANSPDVFFSTLQVPIRSHEISFRSDAELGSVLPAAREAVRRVDPSAPVFLPTSLRDAYRAQTATPRFAASLMTLFSALALVLACVGVYGVLSFTVGERAREIAVRRALGAPAGAVARDVMWKGLRLAGVGLLVGGSAALVLAKLLESLLFQVPTSDPTTFVVVAALLIAVILAATAVPARRASRQEPAEALSSE